jgi:hypothetical protein
MEKGVGKRFFAVDAVLGQHAQVLDVKAGLLDQVEDATWPLADRRTNIGLDMAEPADVLVIGLPRNFHYGPGMGTNPILMSLAIGGQLSRCWNALREGCVVIAAAVCDGWFNPHWFPLTKDVCCAADVLRRRLPAFPRARRSQLRLSLAILNRCRITLPRHEHDQRRQ